MHSGISKQRAPVLCKFSAGRFARGPALCCSIFILCVPSAFAQSFPPEMGVSGADKKVEKTISVRDLSIPRKAFDNFQRGLERLKKRDAAGSITYFSKAIEKYPQYFEAYYHLGIAQQAVGQDEKAAASFQSAVNLSGGKYAVAQYAYAMILCRQGKIMEGERILRYALDTDLSAYRAIGKAFLGHALLMLNQPEEAERNAHEALLLNPRISEAYLVLAAVHARQSDFPAMLQDIDAFLQFEPPGNRAEAVRRIRDAARNRTVPK